MAQALLISLQDGIVTTNDCRIPFETQLVIESRNSLRTRTLPSLCNCDCQSVTTHTPMQGEGDQVLPDGLWIDWHQKVFAMQKMPKERL